MPIFQVKGSLKEPHTGFELFPDEEVARLIGRVRAPDAKTALKRLIKKAENLAKSGYAVNCNYVQKVRFVKIPEEIRTKREKRDGVRTHAIILESWAIEKRTVFSLGEKDADAQVKENKPSRLRLKIRSLLCRHRGKIFTGRYRIENGCVPLYVYGLSAEFYCYYCDRTKWKNLGEKEINAMGKSFVLFFMMHDKEIFTFKQRITPENYISADNWDSFFNNFFPEEIVNKILPFKFVSKKKTGGV